MAENADVPDSFVELVSLVEIPDDEARDSALRDGGVDVETKARRHVRLGEESRPHVSILGRAMMTVDQIRQGTCDSGGKTLSDVVDTAREMHISLGDAGCGRGQPLLIWWL